MEFEAYFKEHQTMIFRMIFSYVRKKDIAEDLTLEAFMEVFQRWNRVQGFENPVGYLVRIAINRAKKHLKTHQNFWLNLDEHEIAQEMNPERYMLLSETNQDLEDALMDIKEIERNIILLRDMENKQFDTIAEILEMKLSTVKSHYRRGKSKLSGIEVV